MPDLLPENVPKPKRVSDRRPLWGIPVLIVWFGLVAASSNSQSVARWAMLASIVVLVSGLLVTLAAFLVNRHSKINADRFVLVGIVVAFVGLVGILAVGGGGD